MNNKIWQVLLVLCGLLLSSQAFASDWMKGLGGLAERVGSSSGGLVSGNTSQHALSRTDMVAGLKDALRVGSERVASRLGKADGFNADKHIHIPLPKQMARVKSALSAVGMGSMMDDLELKLNRAAEQATPKAKRVFADTIQSMKFDDAKRILHGPKDAATQYFKSKMSAPLRKEMQPIVQKALNQAGAVQAYDGVMGQYKSLPFVPDAKANLNQHVLDAALNGIFYYMAKEEAAIRENPVKRSTAILKKVFASGSL